MVVFQVRQIEMFTPSSICNAFCSYSFRSPTALIRSKVTRDRSLRERSTFFPQDHYRERPHCKICCRQNGQTYRLTKRENEIPFPQIRTERYKNSFMNKCLFELMQMFMLSHPFFQIPYDRLRFVKSLFQSSKITIQLVVDNILAPRSPQNTQITKVTQVVRFLKSYFCGRISNPQASCVHGCTGTGKSKHP